MRVDQSGQTTHFVGEWYEDNVTTGIATAYYPFNGRPIAMKQGSTLSYLHHDHLGSLVAATDTSGAEVGGAAWARYSPFGQLRGLSGSGTLPSDRLFTGQTRDNVLGAGVAGNDAYYFFKARYYDATIGQFQSADTVVPNPKSPRALNRYAYALNNPLKLVDPSGHDSMDPNWVGRWESQHPGRGQPSQQDWLDYQFSLSHAGSGPGGAWTTSDWQDYQQTGFLQNLWYTRTTSFALMEGADQDQYGLSVRNPVTLGVDRINDPSSVTVASLAGLPGVDVGTVTVSVHERITGRGAHLDVWLGALGSDPATRFNPKYSLSFGFPPQLGIQQGAGTLTPYARATIGSPGAMSYSASFDLPPGATALQLSVTPNPWAPGAFFLVGGGPVGFAL